MFAWEVACTQVPHELLESHPEARVNRHLPNPRLTFWASWFSCPWTWISQQTVCREHRPGTQPISRTESSTWGSKQQVSGASGFDHCSSTQSLCPSSGFHEQLSLCASTHYLKAP